MKTHKTGVHGGGEGWEDESTVRWPLFSDNNIPLNPNGVGSLLTKWRLDPCSGLRAEPGQPGGEKSEDKEEEEEKKGEKEDGFEEARL